jgi:hypothetical protein
MSFFGNGFFAIGNTPLIVPPRTPMGLYGRPALFVF